MNQFALSMRCWCPRLFLMVLILAVWSTVALADESPAIVRVEEDWELVISTPDPDSDGPQVTSVFSPYGHLDSLHATFEVNHQSEVAFAAGGLQLQIWDGDVLLGDKGFPNRNVLVQPGETVLWTQSLEVQDGHLTFEITNGNSGTWDDFGGQGYLKAILATELTDLSSYSPAVSVGDSGVGYGGNRVSSLVLKSVRVYLSTGEVTEDNTLRVVHPHE